MRPSSASYTPEEVCSAIARVSHITPGSVTFSSIDGRTLSDPSEIQRWSHDTVFDKNGPPPGASGGPRKPSTLCPRFHGEKIGEKKCSASMAGAVAARVALHIVRFFSLSVQNVCSRTGAPPVLSAAPLQFPCQHVQLSLSHTHTQPQASPSIGVYVRFVCVCVCVTIPSFLDASLLLSVYVGASAGTRGLNIFTHWRSCFLRN